MPRPSPFRSVLPSAGAVLETIGGVETAVSFGAADDEARAVRSTVGMADTSFFDRVEIAGKDRVRFLHGQCTNDIKSLRPGEGCRAALLSPKGKMAADLSIVCEADRLVATVEGGRGQALIDRLQRYIVMDDVTVRDVSAATAPLLLAGPEARRMIVQAGGDDPSLLPVFHARTTTVFGLAVQIVADLWTGEQGYELRAPADHAAALWSGFAALGVRPFGASAFDLLRIEAGWARFGVDADEESLPNEALLDHAISYSKGCYTGQEVVARLKTYGQVAKHMAGFFATAVPIPGSRVVDAEGLEVGRVTSAAVSPTLARPVVLAMIRREALKRESPLFAASAGRTIPLEKTDLPFVPRRALPALPT